MVNKTLVPPWGTLQGGHSRLPGQDELWGACVYVGEYFWGDTLVIMGWIMELRQWVLHC